MLKPGHSATVPCQSGLYGVEALLINLSKNLFASRKLSERCSKSSREGSMLLVSSCSQTSAQAPASQLQWEDGPVLSQEVPGWHFLAKAANIKPSCPFLVLPLLIRSRGGTFLQGLTSGC